MYVNKGLTSQIFSRSQRQRWTCSPVRQVEYFGVFFMIRWYQSVYSHKYDLAHVVIHTFNSVFITPQAAIRDGFLIRFLTQKRCPLSLPPFIAFISPVAAKNKAVPWPNRYFLEYIRDSWLCHFQSWAGKVLHCNESLFPISWPPQH